MRWPVACALAARVTPSSLVASLWRDAAGTLVALGASSECRFLAGQPAEDATSVPVPEGFVRTPGLAGSAFAAKRSILPPHLRAGDTAAWAAVAGPVRATTRVYTGLSVRSRVVEPAPDRTSVGDGTSVSVGGDSGGSSAIKKTTRTR